jgi:hypothetical protein
MYNANTPPLEELPSTRALLRSTVIAVCTAAVLLVAVVLPAEYAVDPTGIGRLLGLTRMGEIKMALAEEAAIAEAAEATLAEEAAEAALAAGEGRTEGSAPATTGDGAAAERDGEVDSAIRTDSISITLSPGEGAEIKLAIADGVGVDYRWSVEGGVVNHDTHGDPVDAPAGFYHGYSRGTAMPSDEGVLVAAFDGTHGWFWRNRGTADVTVTLVVRGPYTEMLRLD